MAKYMRVISNKVIQSAANTRTSIKITLPINTKEREVLMIHRIEFTSPSVYQPGSNLYSELAGYLTVREPTADPSYWIADSGWVHGYADVWNNLSIDTTKVLGDEVGPHKCHHGEKIANFDPPLPYPYDEIYLTIFSVNQDAAKWVAVRIYYTVEKLTDAEISALKEMYI